MSSSSPPAPTTRADIVRLIDAFYADVLADPQLQPLFAPFAGKRWALHRQRMIEFWCTTLLHTKSYKGNVLHKHVDLLPRLQPAHFARWLSLWFKHTAAHIGVADATELQARAAVIARNLHLGCFGSVPQFVRVGAEVRLVPP